MTNTSECQQACCVCLAVCASSAHVGRAACRAAARACHAAASVLCVLRPTTAPRLIIGRVSIRAHVGMSGVCLLHCKNQLGSLGPRYLRHGGGVMAAISLPAQLRKTSCVGGGGGDSRGAMHPPSAAPNTWEGRQRVVVRAYAANRKRGGRILWGTQVEHRE